MIWDKTSFFGNFLDLPVVSKKRGTKITKEAPQT
jgi:hypothetical protein